MPRLIFLRKFLRSESGIFWLSVGRPSDFINTMSCEQITLGQIKIREASWTCANIYQFSPLCLKKCAIQNEIRKFMLRPLKHQFSLGKWLLWNDSWTVFSNYLEMASLSSKKWEEWSSQKISGSLKIRINPEKNSKEDEMRGRGSPFPMTVWKHVFNR